MDNNALQKLENIFSEDMFTRKQHKSFTIKDFKDIEKVFNEIIAEDSTSLAFDLAEKKVDRNPQNIIALYTLGMLNFLKGNFQDNSIEKVISIFKKNENWEMVEYLCNKVLEYYECDYALRYLANCYEITKRKDEALGLWERLVKFDTSTPDLPDKIAHIKEKKGALDDAEYYYKISFERNLLKQRSASEASIKKVLDINPDNFNYLAKHEDALSELIEPYVMIDIWKIIFFHYFDNLAYEDALKTIKHLLSYEQSIVKQNNKKAKYFRHRLFDVYNALYPDHSLINEIRDISSILNVFKEPKACMEIFENYIQYDVGKYVIHRNFGVGKVKDITIDYVSIKFVSLDSVRKMTFDMAIKSLITLHDDDINVYKAYKLDEFKSITEKDINKLFTIILKYKNSITTKDLKQELIPTVISESAYTKWLETAKKVVRSSTNIKFEKNTFLYNKDALSYGVESVKKFEATNNFMERYQIYMEYLHYADAKENEESKKMHNYFIQIANDENEKKEYRVISILLLKGHTDKNIANIEDIVKNVQNHIDIYEILPTSGYREKYIEVLKNVYEDEYYEIISKMLYSSQVKNHYLIVNRFISENKVDLLEKTIEDIFFHYKNNPEAFLYFAQKILDGDYVEMIGYNFNVNPEILMANMLSLIPYLNKMSSKKEVASQARKMLKIVYDLIFEKRYLFDFIENEDEEKVKNIYSEFQKNTVLEQHYQTEVITAVTKRFPNLI